MTPEDLAHALVETTHLTVITGAGVSAPSGVSTFRVRGESVMRGNASLEDISSIDMLTRHPEVILSYYGEKFAEIARASSNPAHGAIADLETSRRRVAVFTQNLDNYHELAGSTSVQHFHGAAHTFTCIACQKPVTLATEDYYRLSDVRHECGGRIRPDITLFGEAVPEKPVADISDLLRNKKTDALLVVGTSLKVSPVNMFPLAALDCYIPVYEINLFPTDFTDMFTGFVRGSADRLLPRMVAALEE